MKQIQPDLWETEVERPAPGLTTHAYLLIRDGGNVLFYNTGHLHEIEKMAELGGVAYQYLSHRDELGDSLKLIRDRFDAKLGGHVRERAEFARIRPPDILFDAREVHLGNIEVIPTPGHSPGSTCFLVRSPHGKTYLFTGDTLYLSEGAACRPATYPGSVTGMHWAPALKSCGSSSRTWCYPVPSPASPAFRRWIQGSGPAMWIARSGSCGAERRRPANRRRRSDGVRPPCRRPEMSIPWRPLRRPE